MPLGQIIKEDMRRASSCTINWDKSDDTHRHEQIHLGFNVDLANGLFKIPIAKWEDLREDAAAIHYSKGSRVQARKLA